jgi:hypothetical protein
MSRTLTCLCDGYDLALETARDLEAAGMPTGDISLIANNVENCYCLLPLAPRRGERAGVRGVQREMRIAIGDCRAARPPHPGPLPRSGGEGAKGKSSASGQLSLYLCYL